MNTLVFFMSKLTIASKPVTYDAGGFSVTGTQTNEAAAKFLIRTLAEKGEKLHRIIAITSRETKAGAVDAFRSGVEAFCGEEYACPELITVDNYDGENAISDETVLAAVMERITAEDLVYLDVSGGKRTDADMMMLLMKLVRYKGIRLADAVYSAKPSDTGTICLHNGFYRSLDILDGVNQFAVSGRSTQLSECFGGFDENSCVRRLLGVMEEFSDSISLCSTEKLDDILCRMKSLIGEVSETESEGMDGFLFRQLLPVISGKFFGTGDAPDYCHIILWCLENHLVQQAVTIYVEKMPKYLFDKGLIAATYKLKEQTSAGFEKHEEFNLEKELFFTKLMDAEGLSEEEKDSKQLFEEIRAALLSGEWYSGGDPRVCAAVRNLKGFTRRYIGEGGSQRAIKAILADPKAGEVFHSIAEMLKDRTSLPYKSAAFTKTITNEDRFIRAALGLPPAGKKSAEDITEKKLRTIEKVDSMAIPEGFSLNMTREELGGCMLGYLYARGVRNRINHAASGSATTPRAEALFAKHGIDTAFCEKTIIEQLKKCADFVLGITAKSEEREIAYALSH